MDLSFVFSESGISVQDYVRFESEAGCTGSQTHMQHSSYSKIAAATVYRSLTLHRNAQLVSISAILFHALMLILPVRPHGDNAIAGREVMWMAKQDGQTIIKKYANRRLYNTGTSTYVTLDDLAVMVKDGDDFVVLDAKSGDDITHTVLTQIIFEQESKTGNTLLPVSFLRQLISYYGDQMQMLVPSYLEHSMSAFTAQQDQMREQITKAFGETPATKNMQMPMQVMEEQVRRNTEIFQQAMQMFSPFAGTGKSQAAANEKPKSENKDLKELKDQLRSLQDKLDSLGE
jgi:polyhydroxyalkanoate synthesis repressor PhaR